MCTLISFRTYDRLLSKTFKIYIKRRHSQMFEQILKTLWLPLQPLYSKLSLVSVDSPAESVLYPLLQISPRSYLKQGNKVLFEAAYAGTSYTRYSCSEFNQCYFNSCSFVILLISAMTSQNYLTNYPTC